MPKVSETDLSERRTDILRAARTCFVTYGYDGATVSRLEKETGKSRGAIFHHFRNKETLFREVAHRDMVRMTDLAGNRGMIGLIRYLLEDPELAEWWGLRVEITRRIRLDDELRGVWEADQNALRGAVTERLEEQRESGRLRTDISTATTLQLLELVLEGVMAHLVSDRESGLLPEALDIVEQSLRSAEVRDSA
ncbi:MAG: helix-turn-helix domain-containing protein [Corynebacterium sp.]|uniref:TetR/AcrR family transcriptional regulator n=1 Tax=unclassified Corynebacterium TaxID=2624378 RepID=UPI002648FBF3|nr:TetR/AcrR family transcriptional regulator [Corynebacterium sp.]MDN5580977.1 TetR/AcrR family transcriptional regulator [Corynebacterium sp.]MDN5719601.1 TetR/AcrR family transcriptional regulator [Corynebacterium sp.]MDN6259064.1 TetR/AcrR family transcriptional regulator [Corynebacterium sp.]MDN6324383.1 TetR/AcrR family transcriptional regulator [Corynebacterium sp.]MDN6386616.1 TetR/AcrR family transcriptional regulator [Corynebacterium sp.]